MTFRDKIRTIEKHLKFIVPSPDEQIKIITRAQEYATDWMITGYERDMAILAIIKRRILRKMEGTK